MNLILVISDNSQTRKELEQLSGGQNTFIEPDSGPELNAEFLARVSLVFLEAPLAGRPLPSVLEGIRSRQPDLPVIAILPEANPSLINEAFRAGVYDLLVRPLSQERIRISVDHGVERNRLFGEKEFFRLRSARAEEPRESGVPDTLKVSCPEPMKRFTEILLQAFNGKNFAESLVNTLAEILGLSRAALFLKNGQNRYSARACYGWSEEWARTVYFSGGEGLAGWLEKNRQIIDLESLTESGPPDNSQALLKKDLELACSVICIPLLAREKVNGFLSLGNRISGKKFSDADREFFAFLAGYLGLVIDNAGLYHQVFLKQKEQEMTLHNLGAGVIAVNPDGVITVFNQKAGEILGVAEENFVGKNIQKAGSQLADYTWRALLKKETAQNERIVYVPGKKPLQLSTNLIRDEEDRTAGVVLIFSDLTVIENLVHRVNHFERLNFWHQLASSMAHQIKNPLVSIKTFIQLFPEKHKDAEFREQFYRIVCEDVERLNNIVTDLFEFSEPNELQTTSEPLAEIIRTAWQKAAQDAGRELEVSVECPQTLEIQADRPKLERALFFIFQNAREAMKETGKVTVRCETEDTNHVPSVRIDIQDSGPGISPEKLSEVFSPFYTTKTKNMGMGLPIAQRIIEDHNGRITVESLLKKGTLCRIYLPFQEKTA